jgi:hypothetical protein
MSDLIKKTLVWTEDGNIEPMDTIENDKKLWLVPFWSDLPAQELTRPRRLIRIDSLSYQNAACCIGKLLFRVIRSS